MFYIIEKEFHFSSVSHECICAIFGFCLLILECLHMTNCVDAQATKKIYFYSYINCEFIFMCMERQSSKLCELINQKIAIVQIN